MANLAWNSFLMGHLCRTKPHLNNKFDCLSMKFNAYQNIFTHTILKQNLLEYQNQFWAFTSIVCLCIIMLFTHKSSGKNDLVKVEPPSWAKTANLLPGVWFESANSPFIASKVAFSVSTVRLICPIDTVSLEKSSVQF